MASSDDTTYRLQTGSAKYLWTGTQSGAVTTGRSSHSSVSDPGDGQAAPAVEGTSFSIPDDVAGAGSPALSDAHASDSDPTDYVWNYSFEVDTTDFSFQVTTSTTANDGVYTAIGISGTVGGQTITGLDPGAFGFADDFESFNSGYFDGLDFNGVGFTAGGVVYNPYSFQSSLQLVYGNNVPATPTDVTFSTDAPACYLRGTQIATARGEVAIEDLVVGDLLVTASGALRPLKWIGHRSYAGWLAAGNANVWPICFKPGSLADGVPKRQLLVSPEHAMWLDGVLVPAGLLVNGSSIVKSAAMDEIHYYHLELDTHDIILAEGAAAETFVDDNSRGIFHNAADFYARYPDVPRRPASFCAPRVEDGFELEAICRRLAGRAKNLGADGTAARTHLIGCLEAVSRSVLHGWVLDRAAPARHVSLTVFDNGAAIGEVVADQFRGDLAKAHGGDGRHGFDFHLPETLAPGIRHSFELRSAAGWVLPLHLTCSPVLEPQDTAPKAATTTHDSVHPTGPRRPRALRGRLDIVNRGKIAGWALDADNAERPVVLVASANGRIIARVLANRFRRDLQAAGIGSGRHCFVIPIPPGMLGLEAQEIRVTRELDGAELRGSPFHLPALRDLDADTEMQMSALFAGLNGDAAEARGLAVLARETRALLERRAARHGLRAEREALARHCRRWGPAAPLAPDLVPAAAQRALVIDLQAPCLGRDGGSLAILSHMRALAGLGYAVSFAAAEDGVAEGLAEEGIAVCGQPYYAGVEDVLRLHAGTFDLIYLHRHECADRYLALARLHHPKARIVYSVADLHHVRVARQAQVECRPELLAYSRRLAGIEAHAAARADVVLTHSSTEAQVLRKVAGFGRVHVVPFSAGARPGSRPFAERKGLAFIGSFAHAPNADAVHVLVRDIMPLVWAQDPSITCRIAGHGWRASLLPGLDPRIDIVGATDDLDGLLDSVRLTVAPLRFGAGIKAKVLDSFAAGVPCVMTGIAAEGLPLTAPLSTYVADEFAPIAGHILRLHADQAVNERVGAAAAQLVADRFDQARVTEAMGEALLAPASAHRSHLDEDERRKIRPLSLHRV